MKTKEMNGIWIEAESLPQKGGWVVDTLSMETVGSAYLMAHGMGVPVADAVGRFEIPHDADYSFWVLTRDWTAVWGVADSAGKFCLCIDGNPLPTVLGTNGSAWGWQSAGRIPLCKGTHTLSLHDLTGLNGRCDAIYITESTEKPSNSHEKISRMRQDLNVGEIREYEKEFDLVVVGGGIAGICTALSALLSGVSVALIHDRSILGGCNSSEVRVCMAGKINLPPYPALGNVVRSIAPIMGHPIIYRKEYFEDDRKRLAFEFREGKRGAYRLLLNESVTDVETQNGEITSVICTSTLTGRKTRVRAKLFADCSGDGILARKAGCEMMYGREERQRFGESLAPLTSQRLVMGHSIRWYSEETDAPVSFPDLDWGLHFTDESCLNCTCGDWEQETGFTRDMVTEAEYIRDYGLRAIYSNWSYQKHHFSKKDAFAKRALRWVSPIGGKREGYRAVGDYILTQNDIEERIPHADGTACLTWSIDMHFPEPTNQEQFGEAFRSFAYHRGIVEPYPVPYRCLYAKDVKNLFLGGRLVSASHVAFSSVRVMRTLGELGEVVGMASAVCKEHGCSPREVYTEHLDELKERLSKGVSIPDAFHCEADSDESYHFRDIGWWRLHLGTCEQPDQAEKFKRGVESLGLTHKNPMPKEWES